jgi:repressor LexA
MVGRSRPERRSEKNSGKNPPLTPSQQQVLDYIRECCRVQGAPPSYREIQQHLGYKAVGTVQDHVRALRTKGYLEERGDRRARGLVPAGLVVQGTKRIPIYGEIAAGGPREAPQIELGTAVITDDVPDPCFALRVVGDSMVDAGIFEGDLLIVEAKAKIKSGDIVVALLNGETTVKRYVEKPEGIFLVPENRHLSPIATAGGRLELQGKVVGLQRRF